MKKKILLLTIALVCIIAALAWWQRNNLLALKLSIQVPQADLEQQLHDSQSIMTNVANKAGGITIREVTDEEKEALKNKTLTSEELVQQIIGTPPVSLPSDAPVSSPVPEPSVLPENSPDPVPTATPAPVPVQTQDSAQLELQKRARLSECLAELLVMQAEYTGWLEWANQAAIDDFNALPEKKRTTSMKYSIGLEYMQQAKDKEKECDKRMAALESEIHSILTFLKEDTGLVSEIHSTYLNEKATKKAYYLGLH